MGLRQVAVKVAGLARLDRFAELAVDAVGSAGPGVGALDVLVARRCVVRRLLLHL